MPYNIERHVSRSKYNRQRVYIQFWRRTQRGAGVTCWYLCVDSRSRVRWGLKSFLYYFEARCGRSIIGRWLLIVFIYPALLYSAVDLYSSNHHTSPPPSLLSFLWHVCQHNATEWLIGVERSGSYCPSELHFWYIMNILINHSLGNFFFWKRVRVIR